MWSANRAARGGWLALLCLIAACGFEPMYGEKRGVEVQSELHTVRVALIANRTGQLLRRYLLDRIQTGDQPPPALYQLEVGIIESRQYYGIQRDLTATYARVVLTGTYTLRDLKTQQSAINGSVNVYSSYNVVTDPFNTVVAEQDARERAVKNLGDELISRMAFFLRKGTPPASG